MFFPLQFWGINNMYLGMRGGGILYPWRKGDEGEDSEESQSEG